MAAPFFPNVSAIAQATALQTLLALSVVKLFKSGFVPNENTVDTDLDAVEADFDGYAAATITAWLAPILSDLGGAQITAPTVQFAADPAEATPNSIGGFWVETAAGAVTLIGQFDEPVPITVPGEGLNLTPTIVVPNGQ